MKNFILATLILLVMSCQITAFATTGIYATAEGGWAKQTGLPSKEQMNASNTKRDNFPAGRFGVGYLHDFNENFGVGFEAARGYYSKTTYNLNDGTNIAIKNTTSEFLFVAVTHFKKIDLFGKIGGGRNTATIKKSTGNSDQCKIQLMYGIGINYNFTPHFAATANYLHFNGDKIQAFDNSWKSPGINAFLAGLRVTFW
jgi:hypothetical protein